jgi:hypothetical protein
VTTWNWSSTVPTWTGTTSTGYVQPTIVNQDSPMLSHRGPVEFTTCTDLVVLPEVIWDVNFYYRDLGVDPRATRQELKRAYLDGDGPSSGRKTYCLKQLLDPRIRYAYDRAPLGVRLIDDYVFAEAKRQAINEVARRRRVRPDQDDAEVLEEMQRRGIPRQAISTQAEYLDDTPEAVVDDGPDGVQDEASAREPEVVAPRVYPWQYAYYLWRSNCRDTERLREWQELLVTAFKTKGVTLRLAVGFHGRTPHPWFTYVVGYRLVVFLHESETPTAEAARAVADRVVQDQQAKTLPTH